MMHFFRTSRVIMWLPGAAALLLVATTFFVACEEDDFFGGDDAELRPSDSCSPTCGDGLVCIRDEAGIPDCREPTEGCGRAVCARDAACIEGFCEFDARECPGGCDAGQTCIYGNCITQYTRENACGPLDECRASCGLDVVCIQHCEAAVSETCNECRGDLAQCESRESCEANPTTCCPDQFCGCFPNHPGCSDTPCDLCYIEADGDGATLEQCIADTPECSNCLQPFFECRDELETPGAAGQECRGELCSCLSENVEPLCADDGDATIEFE